MSYLLTIGETGHMDENYKDKITKNLEDAGCNRKEVERFFSCCGSEKKDQQLKVLSQHRQKLLDNVHKCEKQIGCLDYLVYTLQQKEHSQESSDNDEVFDDESYRK